MPYDILGKHISTDALTQWAILHVILPRAS